MDRDIRETGGFRAVEEWYTKLLEPGTGHVHDANGLDISPDGESGVFAGLVQADLYSSPESFIYSVDLAGGEFEPITAGPHDHSPLYSPDGSRVAYLSDTDGSGRSRLAFLDGSPVPETDGAIEYFSWSPSGGRILMGVAGLGADLAGAQGGTTIPRDEDRIVAVVSDDHSEGAWYTARLVLLDLETGAAETLYQPTEQIGWPAVSPGGRIAFVEAICSDRWIVAGELRLIEDSGRISTLDTAEVDVTWLQWMDDGRLAYAGPRNLETAIGWVEPSIGGLTEVWASEDHTFGEWYPRAASAGEAFFVIGESYSIAPEVARIDAGGYHPIASFAPVCLAEAGFKKGEVQSVTWQATDGWQIQGRLVTPATAGPHPLVMDIHGGPIWCHRNRWLGRQRGAELFAQAGFAVFYPNPRGSSGRGQAFAGAVRGDMGGADTGDYLAGLDALVDRGIADPDRLAVTGISYGGFMSAWLITQDTRFAAAVVISPVTNWYSQHRTSQIPYFDELFLEPGASTPGGLFFDRSPAFFADRVRCPTLVLTGDLDKNTPPTQALEFYNSLLEHRAETALVRYPGAGHGARRFPEQIDLVTRALDWFTQALAG
jgi:dipeptidyl aminopeptidase/acylaminoacyl peptidase